jgi:hypothetical protein
MKPKVFYGRFCCGSIEGATSPSMTLTELSRAGMLTTALQERRKVEEAYVQGLQKLARRPQQDGAAALGCVQKMMGAESG